jgi:hypothetical protein
MIVVCSAGTFLRLRFFLIIRDTDMNIAAADPSHYSKTVQMGT